MVMAEKKQQQQKQKPVRKGRTIDKWKKKQWFNIIAPNDFDRKLLGETVAEKPKNVEGRIIKVDMGQLTGQRQKRHISILFKVNRVEGNNANCVTVGHTTSHGFLNRLIRRRMSKIDTVQRLDTSDGKRIKVKAIALTQRKLSKKQETAMRKIVEETIEKAAGKKTYSQLSQELIFGVLASKIFKQLTKIAPVKRVEVIESRLLEGK